MPQVEAILFFEKMDDFYLVSDNRWFGFPAGSKTCITVVFIVINHKPAFVSLTIKPTFGSPRAVSYF